MISPSRYLYLFIAFGLVIAAGLSQGWRYYATQTLVSNQLELNRLSIELIHRNSRNTIEPTVASPWWKPFEQSLRQLQPQLNIFGASAYDASGGRLFGIGTSAIDRIVRQSPGANTARLIYSDLASQLGLIRSQGSLVIFPVSLPSAAAEPASLLMAISVDRELNSITRTQWIIALLTGALLVLFGLLLFLLLRRGQRRIRSGLQADSSARHKAGHDALTGLPNRVLLNDRLHQALEQAKRHQRTVVLMFLDLDGFKPVNDTLGHKAGDMLLRQVARQLGLCIREGDTAARIGGDEFVLVLPLFDSRYSEQISEVADRVRKAVSTPMIFKGKEVPLGCSIGISRYPADGTDAETLLQHADVAMYRAKAKGRNNYQFFAADLAREKDQVADIGQALTRDELCLLFRPRLNLSSGEVAGIIADPHWQRPGFGLTALQPLLAAGRNRPDQQAVGEWLLQSTCMQRRLWKQRQISCGPITVRVFPTLIGIDQLYTSVVRALGNSRLEADLLDLDLSAYQHQIDAHQLESLMKKLKSLGVRLRIDASIGQLLPTVALPFDHLRIAGNDADSGDDTVSRATTEALLVLARKLGRHADAENVTTSTQLRWLKTRSCFSAEGDRISGPLSATDLAAFVDNRRNKKARPASAGNEVPRYG